MMARWITRGGFRRARLSKAGVPPSLIFTHFGLAVAGLLVWGAYLATGLAAAAWAACVLLLPVAGLGMALVSLWLPERSLAAATTAPAATVPAGQAVPAGAAAGTAMVPGANAAADAAGPGPPAARHPPALIVAAHGVFAVATILFALLAAVGSR
jgi:hypothetical protein